MVLAVSSFRRPEKGVATWQKSEDYLFAPVVFEMNVNIQEFRQCTRRGCQLRFPSAAARMLDNSCPRCSAPTVIVARKDSENVEVQDVRIEPGIQHSVILDNLRSAYNVGSIIRTTDGVGVRRVFLCGITPTLDNPKVAKTSLGAAPSIEASYHTNALNVVMDLITKGVFTIALESHPGAMSLFDPELRLGAEPWAIIVGNEVAGVDSGILEHCDLVLSIPMFGKKRSLNVVVAFGIAAYWLRFGLPLQDPKIY